MTRHLLDTGVACPAEKDMILSAALGYVAVHPVHFLLFLLPAVTAGMTAYYMFRLWFLAFTGTPRDQHLHDQAHESPPVMWVPLVILAVFSVGIAWGCAAAGFGEGSVLATAALASAVMVSYARAKSESLGFTPGTGMANVGLAPREVRLAILTIGLLVLGVMGPVGPTNWTCPPDWDCFPPDFFVAGNVALAVTLGLIAILATITTIQRILHVRAQAREG